MTRAWLIAAMVVVGGGCSTRSRDGRLQPVRPPTLVQVTCKPRIEIKRGVREFIEAENRHRVVDQHWIILDNDGSEMRVYWSDSNAPPVDEDTEYTFSVHSTDYAGADETWHLVTRIVRTSDDAVIADMKYDPPLPTPRTEADAADTGEETE